MTTAKDITDTAIRKGIHRLGKCAYSGKARCNEANITFELKRKPEGFVFSMQAEIWKASKSDVLRCGQCVDTVAAFFPQDAKAQRMVEIWKRWHLNDMRAGCEHQRTEGWDKRPIDPSKPLNTYGKHFAGQTSDSWNMLAWVRQDEHPDGLLERPCPKCGYKYGSSWLFEPIPEDVLKEIESWF